MIFKEQTCQHLLDKIGVMVLSLDERGRISMINAAGCKLLGYDSSEELIGKDWFENFIPLDDRGAIRDVFARVMTGKDNQVDHHENSILTRSGKQRIIGWHNTILREDDGRISGLLCTGEDITDRTRVEEELRRNENRYRRFVDHVPDALFIHDGEGKIIDVNEQATTSLGYVRDELLQLNILDIEINYSNAGTRELMRQVFQKKRAMTFRGMHQRKDGRTFPVEAKVNVIEEGEKPLFVTVVRDISDSLHQQRRLTDNRDLLRIIIDSIPDIICVKNGQGRWLLANTFDLQLFGLEDVNYRGKTDVELAQYTPRYREAFLGCRESDLFAWRKKEPCRSTEIIPVAGGQSRIFDVYKIPLFHGDGRRKALVVIGRDMTEQREALEKIRSSESRYRQLFERAPIGIVHFDTRLHVTDCNEHYLHIMQAEREQILGLDMYKMRDKRILPMLEKTLTGKEGRWKGFYKTTLSRKVIYLSARSVPLYDLSGNIQGGMILVEDMSLQQQAQEEKYRLMSAIDQASETIVITDKWGIIEYVNPAFEKMTGYSAAEAHGRNPKILRSGRHDKEFYKEMWQTLRSGRVWKGHIINKRKDGALFEEDATISPVRNQEGEIINYVAVKRDVTEEVALKKQLNQAMKMEAIGTLAGGIAHDFNNILSAVLGYAEMVELQLDEDEPARKDVGQIIAAGQRATDLIRQILTFSRQEEEELRPVKLQLVIKEALKLLRSSLPTSIELQQEVDPGCGPVLADPIRIHQVLMNLCTNAKQAMEGQQGTLRVRLAEFDIDSGAFSGFFPTIESGPWLDLEVSDTGMGMEEQVKERIFDPFFTTKKKGQGTGLGLSVVHGIVKSHNGEITVESEPGRGTTFHIYLPIVETEVYDEHQSGQIILPQGTEHILLVDDEPLLVEIMERFLTMLGYKVKGFIDSREAMAWYGENADQIDLVITDMTMPHLTGAELAREILAQRPEMPIVLCTGYSEVMDAEKAMAMGIRKFIAKPVDNSVLAHSVREALDVPG